MARLVRTTFRRTTLARVAETSQAMTVERASPPKLVPMCPDRATGIDETLRAMARSSRAMT
jgi:hypothetical protein